MANGWLPRDFEEWTEWVGTDMRILKRHSHIRNIGDVPGAIDASGGVDTSPLSDYYVEDLNDDYPLPQPPTSTESLPNEVEDSSPVDGADPPPVEDDSGSSNPIPLGQGYVYGNTGTISMSSGSSSMTISSLTYGSINDTGVVSGGVAPSTFMSTSGIDLFIAEGWYDVQMWVYLQWATEATCPPSFSPYMSGPASQDQFSIDFDIRARAVIAYSGGVAKWGIYAIRNFGRIYFAETGDPFDRAIYPACQAMQPGTANSTTGRCGWLVTKWT